MEHNDTIGAARLDYRLEARNHSRENHAHGAGVLGHALIDALESIGALAHEADGFLSRQAQERPKLMLVCAAGLGFALGSGGLALRTGALMVRVGGRLMLAHFVHRWALPTQKARAARPVG